MADSLPTDSTRLRAWTSLEDLAGHPEVLKLIEREFPEGASRLEHPITRRRFLKLMGASVALAGLTACARPRERIVPYVKAPEEVIPGKPSYFATAMTMGGFATGLLAESHMGRPTKLEGNPDHPASLGATDPFGQAAVLTLYDPDRSQTVLNGGEIASHDAFLVALESALAGPKAKRGAGLRILTETVTSPTLMRQLQALLAAYPAARWHQVEPVGYENALEGATLAYGEPFWPRYDFSRAAVVVSLDADFLAGRPGSVRYNRDFARRRRPEAGMGRLYVAEPVPTLTGAVADHRLAMRAQDVEPFTRALAGALGVAGAHAAPSAHAEAIAAIARDLRANPGAGLVVAGEGQPPAVHALAFAMNEALGNVGATVALIRPPMAGAKDGIESLSELAQAMRAGSVEVLAILGANPALTAPRALGFKQALAHVPFSCHLGLYRDETARLTSWHVPADHFLETWSDARAYDGTVSIIQPLIAPLYQSRSPHELVAAMAGDYTTSAHDAVCATWKARHAGDFEAFWERALKLGVVPNTAEPVVKPAFRPLALPLAPRPQAGLELVIRPDPTIWDGRFANNAWLQELPKPLTSLTWDNVAAMSPATAEALGVKSEDLVTLRYGGQSVKAPVWVMPGHADECVSVTLGYGRTAAGLVGNGVGFDAYPLRTPEALHFGGGLVIKKARGRYKLASSQNHHRLEGRDLAKVLTLADYLAHPDVAEPPPARSLYPDYEYKDHAWGMAIDLNVCTGCSACVVACQAENNIPVVGKAQVLAGREMHWIRVDRYFMGDAEAPSFVFQPRPCMHCEKAPCELVCPVEATVHSKSGLNEQVYNRCIGTRYCSNNCPYKVRRFNFLQYSRKEPDVVKMARNPDVTVRTRGVMEKCTYCVQRINAHRIDAEKEDRPIADGTLQTACQQACPTDAIVFGDLNDPQSRVARLKASPREYGMLAELNTRPRTTYLAKVVHPNPEMGGA